MVEEVEKESDSDVRERALARFCKLQLRFKAQLW